MKKGEPLEYTFSDLMKEHDAVEESHRIIIEYLLNKNSYPLSARKHHSQLAKPPREGIDYVQFYEDMEDFINNLTK